MLRLKLKTEYCIYTTPTAPQEFLDNCGVKEGVISDACKLLYHTFRYHCNDDTGFRAEYWVTFSLTAAIAETPILLKCYDSASREFFLALISGSNPTIGGFVELDPRALPHSCARQIVFFQHGIYLLIQQNSKGTS